MLTEKTGYFRLTRKYNSDFPKGSMTPPLKNPPDPLVLQARNFCALGDADRLRLLSLISAGGEVCNCHLEKVTGFLPSKISRHLGQLKGAGWITGRRHGTWIYYSLSPAAEQGWMRPLLRQLADTDPTLPPQIQEIQRCCGQTAAAPAEALAPHLL